MTLRIHAIFVQIHTVLRFHVDGSLSSHTHRYHRIHAYPESPWGDAMSTFPNFALERRAPCEFWAIGFVA